MKLLSWNVNGLRSTLKKDFAQKMSESSADVIALQEIKAEQHQMRGPVLHGFDEHWNSSVVKQGYSGTLVLSRGSVGKVTCGISSGSEIEGDTAQGEGRVLSVEFPSFHLVNVYAPNSQTKLKRLSTRLQWDAALRTHIQALEAEKPVVLCGDLNVAHHDIDMAHPQRNRGKSGFSNQERESFDQLLAAGYVDAFRHFHKEPDHYTWWRFNKGTREKNLGWRIDYFIVSEALMDRVTDCYHLPDIMGSDHCPVVLDLQQ